MKNEVLINEEKKSIENTKKIPVLPLRDIVIYPNMIVPLFVGREKSIKSIEISIKSDKKLVLLTQKNNLNESPKVEDLFKVGTLSHILQMFKLNDGTIKVLIEGIYRASILDIEDNGNYITANIKNISIVKKIDKEDIFIKIIINQFETYIKLSKKLSIDILISLNEINDISKLVDTIAAHLPIKLNNKQKILEIVDINERINFLIKLIEYEIELLQIEKKIKNRIRKQMEKSQKEYYLNEQIKAIQKELNNINNTNDEYKILKDKINISGMNKDVKIKVENELQKLKMMSPISAEASVIRGYIDWMISMPWKKRNRLKKNINFAQNILDKNHYGLNKVKEYILEYLAVQNRVNKIKGPILCLVGPPGVGKTSLGKSIAKATGRKYVKISLGGIKDEAEIRGHRKTYIGSMPGKLIQKMSKVGVKNPLFLLDEIDKMSFDMRGDPASALLEALDSEQNAYFNDNYLEVDYDLSEVMFVATSNSTEIPTTLLDRMEIIKLHGYSEEEKLNIANNFLLKKQIKINALKDYEIEFDNSSILSIIRYYTKESGVRNLEREISKICRKVVKILLVNKKIKSILINENNIVDFLGIKKFDFGKFEDNLSVGQTIGLAWTEYGGDLLTIESYCVPGRGKLINTGSLGKVMCESIQTALTVAKFKVNKFIVRDYKFYEINDIHVHVPECSTPKDGPSAGVAICLSIISCLINKPIKSGIAITGEITLNGKVLPIGGLKEKILAAKRGNIKYILIPKNNLKDLKEIEIDITDLNIIGISDIEEVINISLI